MVKTFSELKIKYKEYSDIKGKIMREVKKGTYTKVIRGLYETSLSTPGYYLSSYIYGPSYLSFEYALSFYGLIPERVTVYTSATYNKRRTKKYNTFFGRYIYKDIPKTAYPYDIEVFEENGYIYHIASKEKAVCDILYDRKTITSLKQFKKLLFDDLRIDLTAFKTLDFDKIRTLIPKYKSKNLNFFMKYIMEVQDEDN